MNLRLGFPPPLQTAAATCSWRGEGVGGGSPSREPDPVAQELAGCRVAALPWGSHLLSERAVGLSSHLEKFKTVCLGEAGPGGGGSKKHDVTSARPRFPWGEERAGPGRARWDSRESLSWREEETRVGRRRDVRGNARGALEWEPWEDGP